jgi:hypothetical protein
LLLLCKHLLLLVLLVLLHLVVPRELVELLSQLLRLSSPPLLCLLPLC